MTTTPAGWYPDPYGSPQLRWWDGSQWTDATHALEQTGTYGVQSTGQQGVQQSGVSGIHYGGPGHVQQGGVQQGGVQQAGFQQGLPGSTQPGQWGYPAQTAQMPMPQFGAKPPKTTVWPWVLGGVAVVVALSLVIGGAVFFINNRSTEIEASPSTAPSSLAPETPEASAPQPTSSASANVPVSGELPQPSGGRISDPITGLSYAFPGDPWFIPEISEINDPTNSDRPVWTSACVAVAQRNFDGKNHDWMANVYTGELDDVWPYNGPQDLRNLLSLTLLNYEPLFYSPKHERRILRNEAMKVSGHDAWIIEFEMDFTQQAKAGGWKWKTEKGAFVLIDRGTGKRPALFYTSVPDNLDQSVFNQVLDSLQAT